MTGLAWDLTQDDVSAVGEEDVVRFSVNALPRNSLSLFRKLSDLFFFRALCDSLLVTLQTSGDTRYSGEGLSLIVAVAGVTLQPLFEVLLVVKGDGLFGFEAET